ncbi:unnamed protein product [Cyprideis torosa]|uniref:Uncharacterized protein n=1 Tax=Cyprideis torosa TaxID=163714 RepID=A0A7R8ZR64_9CRUS|nr:unnamed protein product [Cyprideis torosa]CAG0893565.1 unnamed protein product [Cyprideis torosa]
MILVHCDRNITTFPAIVASPTVTFPYTDYCIWFLTAPANRSLQIKFEALKTTRASIDCSYYYESVLVYDSHGSENLLGKFCGDHSENLPVITTHNSTASIDALISNQGGGSAEFKAIISLTFGPAQGCGGQLDVGATPIQLRSPDVSGNGAYDPDLQCDWILTGLPSKQLKIQFSIFDLEGRNAAGLCDNDYVEIHDGLDGHSLVIGRYCGQLLPTPIVGSSNWLFIRFVSNSANQMPGFVASVSNVDSPCGPSAINVTSTWQTISSPSYPAPYPPNTRCLWTIEVPPSASELQFEFQDLNLEPSPNCSKDFVLFHGAWEDLDHFADDVLVFCGQSRPPLWRHYAHPFKITFVSDGNANQYPGFRLSIRAEGCNRTYSEDSGSLKLAIQQGVCIYRISPSNGQARNVTVSLYITNLVFDDENECHNDKGLLVYDGSTEASPRLLNGSCDSSRTLHSTGPNLLLKFVSTSGGWMWMDYVVTDQGRGCGGNMSLLSTVSANFHSPFYPNLPNATSYDCTWNLQGRAGSSIQIRFEDFDVGDGPCTRNFLEVYFDSPTSRAATPFTRYCPTDVVSDTVLDRGTSNVRVHFVGRAGEIQGRGFKVQIYSHRIDQERLARRFG